MWEFCVKTGRFRTHKDGRILDIEPDGRTWSVWFRRDSQPHRSLRVGKFATVAEAKAAAQELLFALQHTHTAGAE